MDVALIRNLAKKLLTHIKTVFGNDVGKDLERIE